MSAPGLEAAQGVLQGSQGGQVALELSYAVPLCLYNKEINAAVILWSAYISIVIG